MNRYMSIICSVIFVLLVALPCQVSPASITETKAAIGKDCVASDDYSTAMGWETTASGSVSTAMGSVTTASGYASTAMGYCTTSNGDNSFAGGQYMKLTDTAHNTFVWGYSRTIFIIISFVQPSIYLIFFIPERQAPFAV